MLRSIFETIFKLWNKDSIVEVIFFFLWPHGTIKCFFLIFVHDCGGTVRKNSVPSSVFIKKVSGPRIIIEHVNSDEALSFWYRLFFVEKKNCTVFLPTSSFYGWSKWEVFLPWNIDMQIWWFSYKIKSCILAFTNST